VNDITAAWLNSIYVIGNWFKRAPMSCLITLQPYLVCLIALATEDKHPAPKKKKIGWC
jgi:hypothetical protein